MKAAKFLAAILIFVFSSQINLISQSGVAKIESIRVKSLMVNNKILEKKYSLLNNNDEITWKDGDVFKISIRSNGYKIFPTDDKNLIIVKTNDPKYQNSDTKIDGSSEHYFISRAATRDFNPENFITEPPNEYSFSISDKDIIFVSWEKPNQETLEIIDSEKKNIASFDIKDKSSFSFPLTEKFTAGTYTLKLMPLGVYIIIYID